MFEFFVRSLDASTIFTIAALGELIGQRSGILNVGIEGVMLFGATIGFIVAKTTGSYLLGFLAAIAIGGLIGLLHGFFSITLGGDQVVNGMGIWILGFGLTAYIGYPYTGPLGMDRIPNIMGFSPFFFVGIALIIITWFVISKTNLGLKIRSVGENPSVAEVSGINVTRARYLSVITSGMLMGLAGAIYSLDYNPVWSINFLMGWGFIALALVFFSMWNPFILMGGSILFGTLWQLSLNPQLVLPDILSRYIWRTVPFAITIGVLVLMSTKWFSSRWGLPSLKRLVYPMKKSDKETIMTINSHPTLPEFEYVQPATLVEASEFLASHSIEARPFLGGTDVFVRMRDGFLTPKFLVDVKNLNGTNDLRFDPKKGLTLGAAVNMNRVIASPEVQANYPLLAEACRSVASYQLRTRATVVGNICNASPAGDTIGACLALGGTLHIHGINGPRQESLESFFLGPGKTTLKPGDVATAIHFPIPPKGCVGTYLKLGRNQLSDLSIVGVTALGYPDSSCPSGYRFRLALASVAPVPLVPAEAETYLANNSITTEAIREAARLAAKACTPIDDVRGSARYRKQMVRNLSAKALTKVWEKLK